MPPVSEAMRKQLAKRNGWVHKRGKSAAGGAFSRQRIVTRLKERERTHKRLPPQNSGATTSLPIIKMAYEAKFYEQRAPPPAKAAAARSPTPGPDPAARARSPPRTRQPTAKRAATAHRAAALPPVGDASPVSKRYTDRVCCAGTGVASAPDRAFFEQKRKLWEKKIAFKYGGGNPLEWASTDSKHDPAPDVVIDYKKHWGQLSSERKQTKLCAQKNSRSSLVLGDEDLGKDAYWTSGHDLFSGRVGGADIAEQRRRNAAKRAQLCGSTLVLGSDTEYF